MSDPPGLILLDYLLPDLDGLELIEKLKNQVVSLPCPIVMLMGQGSETITVEAMKSGAKE